MIAGIRYPHIATQYPRFTPWGEVKTIGIYEGADDYILCIERQHGDDVDLLYSRDLARAEQAFDQIVDAIASVGTVIDIIQRDAPADDGPCEHEAERVAYAGDRQIVYHICRHRAGLHQLTCPTPGRPCAVLRDRAVWGDSLP